VDLTVLNVEPGAMRVYPQNLIKLSQQCARKSAAFHKLLLKEVGLWHHTPPRDGLVSCAQHYHISHTHQPKKKGPFEATIRTILFEDITSDAYEIGACERPSLHKCYSKIRPPPLSHTLDSRQQGSANDTRARDAA
jgi:hypothetical protein